MGVLVSPNKHNRILNYLKNGGKEISEWAIAKIGIFNSNVSRSVREGIFQRGPILIGFGLSLIFLVYVVFPLVGHFVIPLDAIAALAALALVGGTMTNGAAPSYLKAIGDNEPLDPKHDGEKAYHLGVLCRLGVNIPPGFALLPSFYINDFIRTKSLTAVWGNVIDSLTQLENKTGQRLGNRNNPIFLSVRSNAGEEESMPGLMKTIVNVGLNQDTFQGLVERDGELFAQDTMRRFIRSYATGVFGIADEEFYLASTDLLLEFGVKEEDQLPVAGMASLVKKYRSIVRAHGKEIPEDGHEQLKESLKAVLKSFDSESARIFKKVRGLTDVGMGAIVQKMVFGNLNDRSGSGVVFTRNRRTGKNTLDGQYGIKIQGEDVVSGRPTTGLKNVENLKTEMPGVYESLLSIKNRVENKFGWPQDLEFTIQKEELFILQARDAELSPEALLKAGGDMMEEGIIPSDVFMAKKAVTMAQTKVLYHLRPDFQGTIVMKGKYGTPGAQRGRMMFSDNFNPSSSFEAPVILVEKNPNAPALLKTLFSPDVCGLLTMETSKVSHAAIRCQSSGMPSVMGISGVRREGNVLLLPDGSQIHEGDWIVVDGDKRRVLLTEETDVLVPSRLISDASLRLSEVEGIEEQIKNQWRDSLYEEILEEYVDASQHLETLKEKFPVVSQSELDIANVRLHTLHLIAWEKGAEQGFSHERVNHDFTSMKQVLLKSVLAEESLRNGEASILLLEDNSMVDRSGTKIPNQMNTDGLFGDRMEENRVKAETERRERYPDYPLREILLSKETRHHDGGGTRYFVQMFYVNVALERVGNEKEKQEYRVDAQNLRFQDIVEKLESGSPDIHYDSAQSGLKHSYSMKNIRINWWPKTERRNDTSLAISINGKGGQNITITEEGTSTKIKFADQPVRELPFSCLRDLFKSNDTVYFVVSPDLLSEMKDNQIPILFSEGGRDPFFIRFVSSTVAPAIKQNIQEQVARDYLEKDNAVLQEFKKTYWDPVLSSLTESQSQALIRLALFIQSRSCLHSVPPFLLLNHDLFKKLVPEMSPEKWEDKAYLKGIEKKLVDSMSMTLPEVLEQLSLLNEDSLNTTPLTDAYYPNLLKLFRAFERKGAVLPFKLTEMLGFLQRVEYKEPWNGDALFRVAAGLLVEEKTQTPPSNESGERESPSQDSIRDSREQAINDAKAVGNILRESVKGLYSPLLNEALLPTNQPLQSLLGGRGVEKESVFDRIMRFQKDPAYVRPFKEALESELEELGFIRDAHLERNQARVVSLNRENFASVQAELSLRDTLNKIFQGFGMKDQKTPLFMTIVIPTSHEAGEKINQLRGGGFLGTYVAHPQLDPGETLTIPKIAKAYGDLIDQGLIGPDISLVPVNKMENLDTASLMKSYSTSLENKVKTMAAMAKDLPELRRMTQEIKSFLEVMKAIMGMA